jgi:hypothetical protein
MNLVGNRYAGEVEDIKPEYKDVELVYITLEQWQQGGHIMCYPSFWFIYKGWLYLGICDYDLPFLSNYDDIIMKSGNRFSPYNPKEEEFNYLTTTWEVTYYKFNYEKVMSDDWNLGHYSEHETDFIKVWNRDRRIDDIIN